MIIGVTGGIGEGKDTFADIFIKHVPYFKNRKFADEVKRLVSFILGCEKEDFENREFKETALGDEWDNITPRELLKSFAEFSKLYINKDIWVESLLVEYSKDSDWVISDLRFENEFNAIKSHGGINILVRRGMTIKEWIKSDLFDDDIIDLTPINTDYNIDTFIYKQDLVSLLKPYNKNMGILLHESERELHDLHESGKIKYDYIIDNSGTIESFEASVIDFIKLYNGKY